MAGTELSNIGKYDVVARIAQGGMAEIFLARQQGIGGFSRRVVLKCILPLLAEEPRFVKMFMEEARLASQIHHPNVVQIFDVGEDEGTYYIAMEYIDGLSVNSMLTKPDGDLRPMPIEVAGEIVAQACAGLHAAHKLTSEDGTPLGLVHRDVSPQNLMVSRDGVVKLVDFGIAKAQDSSVTTRTGSIKGKYAYMSPEQVRGRPLDRRSDVFSLGTVFFELLTGKRLFHRSAELAILVAIIEDPFPSAHELDPTIPKALSDVILKSLEREREGRYGSAAEMGQAVREVLGSLGHYTSPETVAKYLEEQCAEELSARKSQHSGLGTPLTGSSLEARLAELPRQTEEPSLPDEPAERKTGPEIIDLPPPRSRGVEESDRAKLEAKRAGGSSSWVDEPTLKLTPQKSDRDVFVEPVRRGPLPEPDFEDEDDDGEIGNAPTAAAVPIPDEDAPEPEPAPPPAALEGDGEEDDGPTSAAAIPDGRSPSARAPFEVEAPDLDEADDLDDEETVERSIEPEAPAASPRAPAKPGRAATGPGWVEVATASALPSLETLERAEAEGAANAAETESAAGAAGADGAPAASVDQGSTAPAKAKGAADATETERGEPAKSPTPPSSDRVISWPKPRSAAPPPPRRWPLWVGVAAAVAVVGAGVGWYVVSTRDQRPTGVPLIYAHPPSYPQKLIESEFRPLATYLEGRLDRPVEIVTAPDYQTLEAQFLDDEIDFANLPPLLYLLAKQRNSKVAPIAVHAFGKTTTDQAYIIAGSDSDIGTIEELKNRRFCYPDRRSTTGYLLPRRYLRSKGLDPDALFAETTFSKGHSGVLADIRAGRCDAGAVIATALSNASEFGFVSQQYRIIAVAGESVRDVVCASPGFRGPMVEKLRAALLDFNASRDLGREALGAVFAIDHFVDVSNADFADIEAAARDEGLISQQPEP